MGIIERYKIIEKFSEDHYLARDEVSGVLCYLKILTHYEIPVFEHLRRFSNPHVVKVLDYEERDGKLYVYEEYISGETFHDMLLKGSLTEEKKRDILIQICDGLKFLHSAVRPIIHRDLKPQNIVITSDGIVKIIDYDIAKVYKRGQDKDTTFLGTFDYAAPEQYGFAQSDPRTDIFALGKIIEEITKDRQLLDVAKKATEIDPKNRYKNISEMKYAIEHHRNKLWPPPGFRQGKVWHMLIAMAYWMLAIIVIIACQRDYDWPLKKHIFYRVELIIYFSVIADIFTGWTGIFEKVPLRKKHPILYITIGIILVILLSVIVRITNEIAHVVWLDL